VGGDRGLATITRTIVAVVIDATVVATVVVVGIRKRN
jgi:hypothetical protein